MSPREYPDFAWAWMTRFLVSLGNALATLYLLYFLKDAVKDAEPEQAPDRARRGSTRSARSSRPSWRPDAQDRSGRRKIYVIWSTVVMAGQRRDPRCAARRSRPRWWPR